RVTQPWDKTTIMWANQPQYSNADSLIVTTSGFGKENFHLDFTELTQAYVDNPGSSYGFRISFANEKHGSLVILASNNNSDPAIRPKLVVTYK
ncbi:MAG TPA: DNRLRE domain-containing protein, partial [Ignavibacteriales bacterium]|nr:DNRLRE domain-containing protein [Ignavibacteriales bacterium]